MLTTRNFLSQIERFIVRYKFSPTGFGVASMGDPSFVFNVRNGRRPTLAVVERVFAFMRRHEANAKRRAKAKKVRA